MDSSILYHPWKWIGRSACKEMITGLSEGLVDNLERSKIRKKKIKEKNDWLIIQNTTQKMLTNNSTGPIKSSSSGLQQTEVGLREPPVYQNKKASLIYVPVAGPQWPVRTFFKHTVTASFDAHIFGENRPIWRTSRTQPPSPARRWFPIERTKRRL